MSYDLFFKQREGHISPARWAEYFNGRPNYEAGTAQYWNEDTGVYFSFELNEPSDEFDEESDSFAVAFNINYVRPSFFILEAEPEVRAFVKHFDMTVFDPQLEGIGEGVYSAEQLITGWNRGNEFAYWAILHKAGRGEKQLFLPTSELHRIWRWNVKRASLQAQNEGSKFVPKILYQYVNDAFATVAVWPDGAPIITPKVDYFLIGRYDLAPWRLFRRKEDTVCVSWQDIEPILKRYGKEIANGVFDVEYKQVPKDVENFIRNLRLPPFVPRPIGYDEVLDRDIVDSLGFS